MLKASCVWISAPVANASAWAVTIPARSPVYGAGPIPTMMRSMCAGVMPALAHTVLMLVWSRSTWVRESVSVIGS